MSQPPGQLGHEQARPLIVGDPNGAPAKFVEATGMYLGLQKGKQRWVTGTAVQQGLASGVLIELHASGGTIVTAPQGDTVTSTTVIPAPRTTARPAVADVDLAALNREHEALLQDTRTPDEIEAARIALEQAEAKSFAAEGGGNLLAPLTPAAKPQAPTQAPVQAKAPVKGKPAKKAAPAKK